MARLGIRLNGAEVNTIELHDGRSYVAGRAAGNDIPLDDHPGISRQHFRLTQEDDQWVMQVISKFGEVLYNGALVSEIRLTPGAIFKVPPYDFFFIEEAATAAPSPAAANDGSHFPGEQFADNHNAMVPYGESHLPMVAMSSSSHFEGSEEATAIARFEGQAYIRISGDPSQAEETLRLEGNLWIAGRDENCEIQLNDLKTSRHQFELSLASEGYFITDLGSSNGTLLNGSALPANEPTPIRSGDIITVSELTIHFEIRDPNFKDKLVVISQSVMQTPGVLMSSSYPGALGDPSAFSMNDPNSPAHWPREEAEEKRGLDFSKPKTKILAAVAAVVVALAVIMSGNSAKQPGDASGSSAQADPKTIAFEKLNPQQKKVVKDTYQLAKTLLMQKKWELAGEQLRKIHEIIPEGYDESHELVETIAQREQDRLNALAIVQERERIEQNKRKLDQIVKSCERVANQTRSLDEIQNCLTEAYTIDPEDQRLAALVARVQAKIDRVRMQEERQRDYANRVARKRTLYEKAVAVDKQDEMLASIAAYESFLRSTLPDPDNLTGKARARLAELRAAINTEIERRLAAATQKFEANDRKGALAELAQARKIDADNLQISELTDKITKELNTELQAIYSDSILEEGLGNVDSAKEKWRKIIEVDQPNGEYYRKAKSKLRLYGQEV